MSAAVLACSAPAFAREPNNSGTVENFGSGDAIGAELRLGKENRPKGGTITSSLMWTQMREMEQLRQQLAHEERLRTQAEAQAGLGRTARRSIVNAQEQLQLQTQELERLRQRCTELESQHQEATKRAADHEKAANYFQSLLDNKEQAMEALQEQIEHGQSALEDRDRRLKKRLHEIGEANLEKEKLQRENSVLHRRLMALEADGEASEGSDDTSYLWPTVPDSSQYLHEIRKEIQAEIERRFTCMFNEIDTLRSRTLQNEARVQEMKLCQPIYTPVETDMDTCVQHQAALDTEEEQCCSLGSEDASNSDCAMRREIHSLRREVSDLQGHLDEAHNELQQQRQSLEATAQLEESMAELTEKLSFQEANFHSLQMHFDEQSDELMRMREEVVELRVANEQPQTSHIELVQEAGLSVVAEEMNQQVQELRGRNHELLLTAQQLKQDCEMLEVENRSLRESASVFEESLEKVAGQHAKLIGHVNHKQKIRYTVKLQEEKNRLLEELKKTRKQLRATEQGDLLEALPSLRARLQPGLGHVQEGAVEDIIHDFLHMRALIERAVSGVEPSGESDIGTLLKRLRRVVADRFHCRHGATIGADHKQVHGTTHDSQ